MFLNVKLKEIWGFYHLWSTISSKDTENLEKSLHVSGKAKNQH